MKLLDGTNSLSELFFSFFLCESRFLIKFQIDWIEIYSKISLLISMDPKLSDWYAEGTLE